MFAYRLQHCADNALLLLFENLVRFPLFQDSPEAQVKLAVALRRTFSHIPAPPYKSSYLGNWCSKILRSSYRNVRLEAVLLIPTFVNHPYTLVTENCSGIIKDLNELEAGTKQFDFSTETIASAWSHLGEVVEGEALNMVLVKLLLFLGDSNVFSVAIGNRELLRLADARGTSPWGLLSQFWGTLSTLVIDDMQSRPRLLKAVCDLFDFTIEDFLRRTQRFTLPFLIASRNRTAYEAVASACGKSLVEICWDNIVPILTNLITMPTENVVQTSAQLLLDVSETFGSVDIPRLIRAEVISVTSSILQLYDDDVESDLTTALDSAIKIVVRAQLKIPEEKAVDQNDVENYFEETILGIVNVFLSDFKADEARRQYNRKIHCLMGFRHLIRLAGKAVKRAVPQITNCLMSAVLDPCLTTLTLEVWKPLLHAVGDDHMNDFILVTLTMIIHHFGHFSDINKKAAQEIMSQILVIKKQESPASNQWLLPNISESQKAYWELFIPAEELSVIVGKPADNLESILKRSGSENALVTKCALEELYEVLLENQDLIYSTYISADRVLIIRITESLFTCLRRFRNIDSSVLNLVTKCLGALGAIDPYRCRLDISIKQPVIRYLFHDFGEVQNFLVYFIEEHLVYAFRSMTDPVSQGFLAYAMQESLRICGLSVSVLSSWCDSTARDIWDSFSPVSQSTLTPFLTSKFTAPDNDKVIKTYPIYKPGIVYADWLRAFLMDLLSHVEDPKLGDSRISQLFSLFRKVVYGQDLSISRFLLPFVSLYGLVTFPQVCSNIITEISTIFMHPLSSDNNVQRQSLLLASQDIFSIVDNCTKWLRFHLATSAREIKGPGKNGRNQRGTDIKPVEEFLSYIKPAVMATRAYDCGSYARAIFYWEQHIHSFGDLSGSEQDMVLKDQLYRRLHELYGNIDDPDSLSGISTMFPIIRIGDSAAALEGYSKHKIQTWNQEAILHRKYHRWSKAKTCYESILQIEPSDEKSYQNVLICLKESEDFLALSDKLDLGLSKSLLFDVNSIQLGIEACWRRCNWSKLDSWLAYFNDLNMKTGMESTFSIEIGYLLNFMRKRDFSSFIIHMNKARKQVTEHLSETHASSLFETRDSMVKLHVLQDLESFASIADSGYGSDEDKKLFDRLELTGQSFEARSLILSVQRAALSVTYPADVSEPFIGKRWMAHLKLARRSGESQLAYRYLLDAERFPHCDTDVEYARLLWNDEQHRQAIKHLANTLANSKALSEDSNSLKRAKTLLLYAKWYDASDQGSSDKVLEKYSQVCTVNQTYESGHYYLAKYLTKRMEAEQQLPYRERSQNSLYGRDVIHICRSYLNSLECGTKFTHQTMPKLLTLWLDFSEKIEEYEALAKEKGSQSLSAAVRTNVNSNERQLLKWMQESFQQIPKYMLYDSLSYMISRVCHKSKEVRSVLCSAIANVIATYPEYTMWQLMAIRKSTDPERRAEGNNISRKVLRRKDVGAIMKSAAFLTEGLLNICNRVIPDATHRMNIVELGFNKSILPCPLVMPIQKEVHMTLPERNISPEFDPFSASKVTIYSVSDKVTILSSLQKPRRITFIGTDGKEYSFLCKPKDDLRKDARLMEVTDTMNRIFKNQAEANLRQLHIRSYRVTVLNEECGLIEWVPNMNTLRSLIETLYIKKGQRIDYSYLREVFKKNSPDAPDRFKNEILTKYKPVFHEWFFEVFPEPSIWIEAKSNFARTYAVMCMVGFILGLGDRHGENILVDEASGDILHVDFNCLFDKGLMFDQPEVVPFRLTQNVVDGLSITGYEGTFRRTAEITMQLLRENQDLIINILESFLHDPVVELTTSKKRGSRKPASRTASAEEALLKLKNKIRGVLHSGTPLPLSVEGQVDQLILEATDINRLSRMYIGWLPFF
ncbi:hypothetical protein CANCADRAFT_23151 [Tortispora caseinolytica NRRL Y-17796]|uniref:non-specific serine/threonine protein kinase n=1 Tax=Tortispora caseinolytica NRRL Y-17796 TaxID=767744 RepID=A0A1E4TKB1_9ASCO|nr:hypothetical protein CANCADRAFT_23151 [Tortispora caseinolytica NRRL Y-17796]